MVKFMTSQQEEALAQLMLLQTKAELNYELRAHLNVILGFSQLLQSNNKEPLTNNQIKWVEHIYQAGKLLMSLMEEILEVAKIEKKADFSKNHHIMFGSFTQDLQEELAQINKRLEAMSLNQITAVKLLNHYTVDLI